MSDNSWLEELDDLESAEAFLNFFEVAYEQQVVHVNRLHILQRFHDYLKQSAPQAEPAAERLRYADALRRAYGDFVSSDAQTQKALKVFRIGEPQEVRIPLDQLITRMPAS